MRRCPPGWSGKAGGRFERGDGEPDEHDEWDGSDPSEDAPIEGKERGPGEQAEAAPGPSRRPETAGRRCGGLGCGHRAGPSMEPGQLGMWSDGVGFSSARPREHFNHWPAWWAPVPCGEVDHGVGIGGTAEVRGPCQSTGATRGPRGGHRVGWGSKSADPAKSKSTVRRAAEGWGCGGDPASLRSAVRTNNSKQTILLTGLPGKPNTMACPEVRTTPVFPV
ncbi:MAG: hypothetical protein CM1200mP2_08830 [Planctomycetaceae bacterium]|nr:MAG: hypothetical protein CM1200mP2_08830 [Planctomycetaceae bacterium]